MGRIAGRKGLSVKLQLSKLTTKLPTELYEWLHQKSEQEGKTISLILTEILEKAKQEEEAQQGGK